MNCKNCGSPLTHKDSACQYCGTHSTSKKRKTIVKVSGSNNKLTVIYHKDSYMADLTVSGSNKKVNLYTNSELDVTISGSNNRLYVNGLNIINQKESGSCNEIKVW